MLTGDVVVFEDDIGLFAITECLHILLGNLCECFIGEFLVWVRIERTVEHRFLGTAVLRYQCLHISKHVLHRITTILVLIQLSGKKNIRFSFFHLFEVVAECSSEVLRC